MLNCRLFTYVTEKAEAGRLKVKNGSVWDTKEVEQELWLSMR